MAKYASKVIAQAKAWLGCKESDGSHKKIIDTYNAHKPLARGYTVKYTDAWCATFVSAVAISCGYTDIIPTECGCGEMVKLLQKIGAWDESDSRKPNPGDILFFNWQAAATGDDTGWPDHVGIVEKVEGNTITLIEGNYSNSVKRRTLQVDDKRIRGYGVPKYDAEPAAEPEHWYRIRKSWEDAKSQVAAYKDPEAAKKNCPEGYSVFNWNGNCIYYNGGGEFVTDAKELFIRGVQDACGATDDGIAGPETLSKTVTISATVNKKHPVVVHVQMYLYALGYEEVGTADGIAGPKFTSALAHFQQDNECTPTGIAEAWGKTWQKLLELA